MVIKRKATPDYGVWHDWFAWHPVKCEGSWVWMHPIERKWVRTSVGGFWVYRFQDPFTPGFVAV